MLLVEGYVSARGIRVRPAAQLRNVEREERLGTPPNIPDLIRGQGQFDGQIGRRLGNLNRIRQQAVGQGHRLCIDFDRIRPADEIQSQGILGREGYSDCAGGEIRSLQRVGIDGVQGHPARNMSADQQARTDPYWRVPSRHPPTFDTRHLLQQKTGISGA